MSDLHRWRRMCKILLIRDIFNSRVVSCISVMLLLKLLRRSQIWILSGSLPIDAVVIRHDGDYSVVLAPKLGTSLFESRLVEN